MWGHHWLKISLGRSLAQKPSQIWIFAAPSFHIISSLFISQIFSFTCWGHLVVEHFWPRNLFLRACKQPFSVIDKIFTSDVKKKKKELHVLQSFSFLQNECVIQYVCFAWLQYAMLVPAAVLFAFGVVVFFCLIPSPDQIGKSNKKRLCVA